MKRTTGSQPMGDRYAHDLRTCSPSKGWAQFDTRQDASYHGIWINPITLEYFSYVEGDLTHIQYDSESEMTRDVLQAIAWHTERGYFLGIDGMCRPEIIEACKRLGLGDHLH